MAATAPADDSERRVHSARWRTTTQEEVDFVVELPSGRLLPIEVKAAAQP